MDNKIIGDKEVFAIGYSFVDENTTEISMYHNNQNILEFERSGCLYTTRWNIDEVAFWLRDFINNMCDDPYPVDTEGEFASQKDQSAREFDTDDDEVFDAYYDKLDDWNQRHRWHPASSGAILADLYFQQVGDTVEVSWNNLDSENGVRFTCLDGGFVVKKDTFISVIESFLKKYAERQ